MDEQKIREILGHLHAPEHDKVMENQAVERAVAAFDKKTQKKTQGLNALLRLTDIGNAINNVRRFIMKKRYVASGLMGGVALAALVGVLGMPFIAQQMEQMTGVKSLGTATPVQDAAVSLVAPQEEALKEIRTLAEVEQKAKKNERQAGKVMEMAVPVASAPSRMSQEMDMATINMVAPSSMPVISDQIQQSFYKDVGRDRFQDFEENSVKSVMAEPVSTFSIDVDTASYSFMRRQLNNGILPQKDAVRIEELINYFDYNYAVPQAGADPFKPTVAVFKSPWKDGNKIIHIGIKGYEIQEKPKSNLVFLLDTSGSMNSPDKLPLLKNSFKMMLDSLQPEDTVAIVVYAGSAGTVLEPTKVSDKQKIIAALDNLNAGGATAGAEGIRQAYHLAEQSFIKGGNNRILLATDGDFNVGITNPEELQDFVERQRDKGIFLSVLGFGQGNYNDQIMQTLAQNGNGNAAYIDNLNEARKVLVEEANSTLFTIAKDVKIQVEFNPAAVSEYRLIGYETRHLNREDFNNDKVDAGEVGAGHAVTAIYEITPAGNPPLLDALRYGEKTSGAEQAKNVDELAFLKIRYKKPDSDTSVLMTLPITKADEQAVDTLSDDVRFASAVAGFGQLLKGSKFAGALTYDQVIEMANNARGRDEFGYRTEFVNLVRLAKTAAALEPQQQ